MHSLRQALAERQGGKGSGLRIEEVDDSADKQEVKAELRICVTSRLELQIAAGSSGAVERKRTKSLRLKRLITVLTNKK